VRVAHVELSLSESFVPRSEVPAATIAGMGCWARSVGGAEEACLVIDADGRIVAASASCHDLLGLGPAGNAVGRYLLDGIRLVDFTAAREELNEVDVETTPPLLALSSGRLARGLMRVHDGSDFDATVDAIATPLSQDGKVVGSLTFFAPI
jgi:PAS domain-containing protein